LNDRAADIWEPLLALADLAGGPWPELARKAAVHLSAGTQDTSPIGALLLDIYFVFASIKVGLDKKTDAQGGAANSTSQPERIFTRDLVAALNYRRDRPWAETFKGKEITELWLASQLRPFGIRPHNLWIDGVQAKGYVMEDFLDIFRRYISKSELETLKAYWQPAAPPEKNGEPPPNGSP